MPNRRSTNRCCRSWSGSPRRGVARCISFHSVEVPQLEASIAAVAVWVASWKNSLLDVIFETRTSSNMRASGRLLLQTKKFGTHARSCQKAGLSVRGLKAQSNQLPGGHAHLSGDLFKRFLPQVATPNLDRSAIRPRQAGLTFFSCRAERLDNSP